MTEKTQNQPEDARRQRKRLLDRNAQRTLRLKTKNRIASLERMVEDLQNSNTDERSRDLELRLTEVTQERDDLLLAFAAIEKTMSLTKSSATRHGTDCSRKDGLRSARASPVGFTEKDDQNEQTKNSLASEGSEGSTHSHRSVVDEDVDDGFSQSFAPDRVVEEPSAETPVDRQCSCQKPFSFQNLDLNIWRCANEILAVPSPMTEEGIKLEDEHSDDVAVRAVMEGWEKIDDRTLSPLWKKVCLIDQFIFSRCQPVERLAAIISTHLMLRYQHDTSRHRSEVLPHWFRERPSQALPHPLAIDFFCWPGVRERLIFNQHSYCTNRFWQLITKSFRILWADAIDNCYFYDQQKRQYAISRSFRNRIEDINAWAMLPEFFGTFHDLRADIPTVDSIPINLGLLEPDKDKAAKTNQDQEPATVVDSSHSSIHNQWAIADFGLASDLLPVPGFAANVSTFYENNSTF